MINPRSNFDGKFHKGKGGEFCQVCDSCGASLLQPQVWGGGQREVFERQQCFAELAFCLQCASPPWTGEKRQRDKCQMASSVTPYEMPLIMAGEGHLLQPLGERQGYHDCKKKREVCWCCKWNQAQDLQATLEVKWRHLGMTFPESPASLKSKGITVGEMVVFVCPTSTLLFLLTLALTFLGRDAPFPTLQSLWYTEGRCITPPEGGPETRSDQSACSAVSHTEWLMDGHDAKGESYSTTSIL